MHKPFILISSTLKSVQNICMISFDIILLNIHLVTLPSDALCLMLVIDGSGIRIETEKCDSNQYSLCCKYLYNCCIHSPVLYRFYS